MWLSSVFFYLGRVVWGYVLSNPYPHQSCTTVQYLFETESILENPLQIFTNLFLPLTYMIFFLDTVGTNCFR